ncbi:MAG TPA: hypothetical protein VFD38_13905 [Myxococcaceae bacterium]|nr:hypothetical protein [Myxococcaceae bacterium]
MVVDVDAAPAGGELAAAPEGLTRAAIPLVRSGEHPHCPALWIQRQARLGVTATALLFASPQHRAEVAAPEQLPLPAKWALRHAPKHSPPA